ncbi:nose resistant to fluoxetine protein 6-like [Chrysoperla carnea]|uniref:nose resistant to fluoxetine protein 6-like n=1 Tax=Chrysoperla carnea TaxID=189513 RepID=UPI001D05D45F|nr:nose resistant to fluoxetine protein 6-like [Chrysoperla carnea]
MMDASSKIQAGIYFGNIADLGSFDECLRIRNEEEKIKGKYCLAKLDIPMLHNGSNDNEETDSHSTYDHKMRWSICVPDGCTAEDVEAHLNSYDQNLNFTLKEDQCQTIESQLKLNSSDWIIIGILIGLACVILLSTIYDIFLHYITKDPVHPLTVAFSWFTNFKKLTQINNNSDVLPCLNGIRVLSMFWIIHSHEILYASESPMINMKEAKEIWLTHIWSLFTLSSSVATDTFLFLSGLLIMYGFLKSRAKKIPFNIPIFHMHRYLRLTPSYAALIILYLTLYMKLGSGPIWETCNQRLQDNCKEFWWTSLLYIQNFVNADRVCADQSWYLFVDMQLYILSPLILIPIDKWPKIAPYLFGSLVAAFTIIPTTVAWYYDIQVISTNRVINDWNKIYYGQVHTRGGPWMIGLVLGYILFQTKHKKIRINKILAAFLWLFTVLAILYIIFGIYPKFDFQYSKLYSIIYIGFHRNVWALGLCWIVFACVHGYGGPVNWFLSLSVFQFLAKITYATYILSEGFQNYNRGILRVPVVFKNFYFLKSFFSTTCFCTVLSIIWVLCFEAPFGIIDGVIIKAVSNIARKENVKREKVKQDT